MRLSFFVAPMAAAVPLIAVAEQDFSDPSQVIVTASRLAEPLDDAIASVTVITRADIDRLQPRSVDELLSGLAGITVSNDGDLGKTTSVFVRGTNSDHVLVLIDGIKIGSATIGTAAWEQLPVEQIDHIEIVRGPYSSLYGSEAIGGVVQIFTRHGTPGAAGVPSLEVSGGSHGTFQGEAGYSASVGSGWYNGSASGLYTSGIPICAANAPVTADCYTTTPQQGYWNGSEALSGGYRWDDVTATVDFLRADGLSKFDGTIYSGDESREAQQALGGTVTLTPLALLSITLAAGQSKDQSQTYFAGVPDGFFDTRRDTLSWLNQLSLTPTQKFMLGADFERDVIASDTDYAVQSRNDTGLFGLYQWLGGHQELQLSERYDDNQQFGEHFTGSAQWAYRWSDALRLTASYGTAFKAPTFNDLYYPFYGDPTLRPETSHSTEVGLNGLASIFNWTLNAYETEINDLIEYNPETFGASNIDRARIRGLEGQLGTHVQQWRAQLQVTLLDALDTGVDYGELLPLRARYTARLDVDRDIGKFSVGATLFESGPRFEDPANTERLGGYGTLDLRTAWRFQPHWELQALLKNALNKNYETALYYNQPGISAYLTVRYLPSQP
ncbi:MAG: TonB-dependent receptor [Steroidobacteraceae bacterium]